VARVSVVVLGAIFGATLAWAFLAGATVRDRDAERRALETRAAELNAQTLAPGSSLACLDALAGEKVESACEKALFAAPATVAIATSYVAARLVLLADVVAYTRHGGANIDSALLPLRRALEADRFGFVAHTLAVRDGCTSENCKALALLADPGRVRANLSGQTLDRYLDHYLTAWAQPSDVPMADAASAQPSAMNQTGPLGPHKVDIDFPTAASIPAISIMNPEPKGSASAGAAAATANAAEPTAPSTPSSPSRKPGKKPVIPPAQAAAVAPAAPATPVDPVWAPAPPAPQTGASIGTAAAAPVQLNPFPAQVPAPRGQ